MFCIDTCVKVKRKGKTVKKLATIFSLVLTILTFTSTINAANVFFLSSVQSSLESALDYICDAPGETESVNVINIGGLWSLRIRGRRYKLFSDRFQKRDLGSIEVMALTYRHDSDRIQAIAVSEDISLDELISQIRRVKDSRSSLQIRGVKDSRSSLKNGLQSQPSGLLGIDSDVVTVSASEKGLVDTGILPMVKNVLASPQGAGNVLISYELEGVTSDIHVEFISGSRTTWTAATVSGQTVGLVPSKRHSFLWKTSRDVDETSSGLTVRITPMDSSVSTVGISGYLELSNFSNSVRPSEMANSHYVENLDDWKTENEVDYESRSTLEVIIDYLSLRSDSNIGRVSEPAFIE